MSTYVAKAFNPVSKLIEDATYVDDYYGRHKYGIRFDDGLVNPQAHCGLDAAAAALTAKDKEIEALRDSLKAWSSRYQHMSECEKLAEARAETAERRVAELEAHCVRLGQGGAERYWEGRWRDEAKENDQLRRERDEARAALKPFTAYTVKAITVSEEYDYCVHVACAVDDQPMFKHFAAARAVINKGE